MLKNILWSETIFVLLYTDILKFEIIIQYIVVYVNPMLNNTVEDPNCGENTRINYKNVLTKHLDACIINSG